MPKRKKRRSTAKLSPLGKLRQTIRERPEDANTSAVEHAVLLKKLGVKKQPKSNAKVVEWMAHRDP